MSGSAAAPKEELFQHLRKRWSDLFGARYEVLLYDLTSTYFECDVPSEESDPRRFGYSHDRRGDCVQVVVALVVTPEGLPLAYEMFPGNTTDKTTLHGMIDTIRSRSGSAERIWVMDGAFPPRKSSANFEREKKPLCGIWSARRRDGSHVTRRIWSRYPGRKSGRVCG